MSRLIQPLCADRDRPVLYDHGGTWTAGASVDLIHRTAHALHGLGHGPGRVAALLGSSSVRTYLASHAIELTGGAQVELPAALPADQQRALVRECGVRFVLADPETVPAEVMAAAADLPGTELLTLGRPAGVGRDLLAREVSRAPVESGARPGEPSRITLTGGTTGRSKPVLRRFLPPGRGRAVWLMRMVKENPIPVTLLKTGRLTGLGRSVADAAVATGGRFVTGPRFDPEHVCALIAEQGVTHLILAPHELELLVEHPALEGADTSSLRFVMSATAATPPALLRRATAALGPIVYPAYGQTEAGLISWLPPRDQEQEDTGALRSCGRLLEGTQVQIRDADRLPLGSGERGRVWVSTPNMMQGYWQRPEATARALVDGWLDTGDTGLLDERGLLTVLGRAGEAMWVRGEEVFASEIDTLLQDHPGVRSCATFDDLEPKGRGLHTAVVRAEGEQASAEQLRTWLADRAEGVPVPDSVLFVSRLPLTYAHELCRDTLRSWRAGEPSPFATNTVPDPSDPARTRSVARRPQSPRVRKTV